MKKVSLIFFSLCLIFSLVGCVPVGESSSTPSNSLGDGIHIPEEALRVDSLGIALVLPESLQLQVGNVLLTSAAGDYVRSEVQIYGQLLLLYQSQEVYDRLIQLSKLGQELSNNEYASMSKQVKRICAITSLDGATLEEYLTQSEDLKPITGFENNEFLGQTEDYHFYFSWDDEDISSLSESSRTQYRDIRALLPKMLENTIYYAPTTVQE